jgi:hypothetical protein
MGGTDRAKSRSVPPVLHRRESITTHTDLYSLLGLRITSNAGSSARIAGSPGVPSASIRAIVAEQAYQQVQEAYRVFGDAERRRDYDRGGRRPPPSALEATVASRVRLRRRRRAAGATFGAVRRRLPARASDQLRTGPDLTRRSACRLQTRSGGGRADPVTRQVWCHVWRAGQRSCGCRLRRVAERATAVGLHTWCSAELRDGLDRVGWRRAAPIAAVLASGPHEVVTVRGARHRAGACIAIPGRGYG